MRVANPYQNNVSKLFLVVVAATLAACSSGPAEEFVPVTVSGKVAMQAGPLPAAP